MVISCYVEEQKKKHVSIRQSKSHPTFDSSVNFPEESVTSERKLGQKEDDVEHGIVNKTALKKLETVRSCALLSI